MKKLYLPLSVQISIVSSSPSFFHFLLLFLLPLRFFSSLSSSSSFFFLFSLFFSPLNPFERRRAKSVAVPCNFYRRFEIRILETRWIPRKNCSIRDFFFQARKSGHGCFEFFVFEKSLSRHVSTIESFLLFFFLEIISLISQLAYSFRRDRKSSGEGRRRKKGK